MKYRRRRVFGVLLICAAIAVAVLQQQAEHTTAPSSTAAPTTSTPQTTDGPSAPAPQPAVALATTVLEQLPVKGRAPNTDYRRVQFGDGWILVGNCSTREIILNRDLVNPTIGGSCKVASGTLNDPYTGTTIAFQRGPSTSDLVQIDHVVALSNAWQTGAQLLTVDQRVALANDPLELLAVDGKANQAKSDGDAATWLPANKAFRCQYVARQIAVKAKYQLWVTQSEKDAMQRVLADCPEQTVPAES